MYFTIYLIGVFIAGMFGSYKYGQMSASVQDRMIGPLIFFAVFWPVIPIIFPFALMAEIGKRKKEQRNRG